MAKQKTNLNLEVTKFIDELNHPFRKEIELLRLTILNAHSGLTENIKWNGPNYCFNNDDRITMRVQPLKKTSSTHFSSRAKVKVQPKQKLISDESGMLTWKENDRAVATFTSMADIEKNANVLSNIVQEWIHEAS
jgi:hypothetical protein